MYKSNKSLLYLTLYSFILFSIIPLLRLSLPMDTQEAIVWGKYCLWGTTKHPPFSGWTAYIFYKLLGSWDGALYILSQLCVVCGILYIYKLARGFFDENKAAMAAILQFGIIYYHFSTVEFNVNVLSIALWPMCAYYFWQSYTRNRLSDWMLFGLLVSINLLNKYVSIILFVSLLIFVFADRGALRLLKNIKAYLAFMIAVIVITPHLWWMYQNNFETLNYFASRSGNGSSAWWGHFTYPLKFVFAQVLFAAATLVTYFVLYRKNAGEMKSENRREKLFIAIVAIAPISLFALTSVISGNALKSMWGFPCLFMWGIALIYFYPLEFSEKLHKKLSLIMGIWVSLFAIGYTAQCLFTTSPRFVTDVGAFSHKMEQKWHEYTGKPLEYVGSDVWYADMLALYGSKEIKPMIWLKPQSNPWFDAHDFKQKGALVIANDEGEYNYYKQMYGDDITAPQKMTVEFKNYFAKTKIKEILYGFYLPKESKNAE
ncbi:MAG: glycosyltransferase family 39 protein [Alphaproteobacteria bacterium]|nr:glycosyltransferase family 39 protein [Alphaproteobacteria bacterium]